MPDPAEAAKAELESRPGHKEDTEEWKKLHPGESKVVQGYEEYVTTNHVNMSHFATLSTLHSKPMSDKGKMLMDIYEEVMSRPPPVCNTSHPLSVLSSHQQNRFLFREPLTTPAPRRHASSTLQARHAGSAKSMVTLTHSQKIGFFLQKKKKIKTTTSRCMYSHAGKSGNGGVFFQRPDPRSKVDCVFFKSGRCLKHQNCPFKHERPQPKRELTNPDLPPP